MAGYAELSLKETKKEVKMPYSANLYNGVVNAYGALKLTIMRSGSNVRVYAQNMGNHIVVIKRIILCWQYSGGGKTFLYLRRPQFVVGDQIEQGLTWLMYSTTLPATVTDILAEAEYLEFTGRSISNPL